MLPDKLRLWLFDRLSVKTMRHVKAVPKARATGLIQDVYRMIEDDFFMNGSLTSRSPVPELLAAIWTADGRRCWSTTPWTGRPRRRSAPCSPTPTPAPTAATC